MCARKSVEKCITSGFRRRWYKSVQFLRSLTMKIRIKRHKESTSLRDFREENFIDMLELSIKPEALLKIMSNCPNVILLPHPKQENSAQSGIYCCYRWVQQLKVCEIRFVFFIFVKLSYKCFKCALSTRGPLSFIYKGCHLQENSVQ